MVEPMAALAEKNGDVASFAIVYVAEAHAGEQDLSTTIGVRFKYPGA